MFAFHNLSAKIVKKVEEKRIHIYSRHQFKNILFLSLGDSINWS